MKIALCTTTINVPHVLKLYRACDADVAFFVACDKKTPEFKNLSDIAPICFIRSYEQVIWKCSEPIGWNTLARRNIAFLEALKWGADFIVSVDDDNIPLSNQYFFDFARYLWYPESSDYNGLLASGNTLDCTSDWFDAGRMLTPRAKHRGIPHKKHQHHYSATTGAKVGVCAGMCLGDPDIDATTRLEHAPDIHGVSELARSGVIVDLNTRTVFNSQNTAVLREFIPSWFMMPGVGRYDDIYASLIVQRVMRERNYHVHFGKPFVWQQRNQHNLISDLRKEIDGMENVEAFANTLDAIILPGKSVIEDTRIIYQALRAFEPVSHAVDAAMAYLDDCEGILE